MNSILKKVSFVILAVFGAVSTQAQPGDGGSKPRQPLSILITQ